ncbi:hypothetical protein COO60DRAFT_1526211 [Scenedesmus sp. NREL 46B-D3]|nr:hypothetical protein COO60DRAFT_1526211 [Scenedesmus sp. NREL 46B-D3]
MCTICHMLFCILRLMQQVQWRQVVAVTAGCLLLCNLHRSTFAVLLPDLAAQLGLRASQAGAVQAAMLAAYLAGQQDWRSLPQQDWRSPPQQDWRSLPQQDWRSQPQQDWRSQPQQDWRSQPQQYWRSQPQQDWRSQPQQDWRSQPQQTGGWHWQQRQLVSILDSMPLSQQRTSHVHTLHFVLLSPGPKSSTHLTSPSTGTG